MREEVPLREITTAEVWKEVQKLRNELLAHNHLDIGNGGQLLNGAMNGILQSTNFVSGSSGCQINWNTGDVEFNSGVFRGTLSAASGTLGAITIGTNAYHIDSSGNTWWGNYATYADAVIKISAAGSANLSGLVVGTNVGLGTAQDSSGVTTIIGDTVITEFVNALSVKAGSVAAENITGTTITGKTIQTAATGTRLKMYYVGNPDFAGYIDFLTNDTILAQLKTDILFPSGGGAKINLNYADTQSGEVNEMAIAWSGSELYNGNAWFRLRNYYCGLYYDASTARTTFYSNARYKSSILPDINNSIDLGSSTYKFKDLNLSGNIIIDGTVDGTDISAHVANASAHHSSTSDGLTITPANVNINADGYIQRAGTNYVRLTSTYFDMYKGIGIFNSASDLTNYKGGFFFSTSSGRFRGNDTGGSSWRDLCFYDERNAASPIPTFESGIEQLKKIGNPTILEKEGLAFDIDAFPKEFQMEIGANKEKHTNLLSVIGMLIQSQKEIVEKVEKLESV